MEAIIRMFTPSKHKEDAPPAPMPMPATPTPEKAEDTAQAAATKKRKAIARSRTIFTSPLGISGQASVIKKTLLGQ